MVCTMGHAFYKCYTITADASAYHVNTGIKLLVMLPMLTSAVIQDQYFNVPPQQLHCIVSD